MDKKETTYKEAGQVSEKTLAKLKQRFGDSPTYYNYFNEDSGIFHHDMDAFNSNNLHNKG